mmetsp:Transcript_24567/g.62007  ORF Transcript_24567/g.62007 Transcript_24567/m.62007 type:complete len:269 (-) Transcript_24567:1414-2220(-)
MYRLYVLRPRIRGVGKGAPRRRQAAERAPPRPPPRLPLHPGLGHLRTAPLPPRPLRAHRPPPRPPRRRGRLGRGPRGDPGAAQRVRGVRDGADRLLQDPGGDARHPFPRVLGGGVRPRRRRPPRPRPRRRFRRGAGGAAPRGPAGRAGGQGQAWRGGGEAELQPWGAPEAARQRPSAGVAPLWGGQEGPLVPGLPGAERGAELPQAAAQRDSARLGGRQGVTGGRPLWAAVLLAFRPQRLSEGVQRDAERGARPQRQQAGVPGHRGHP